MLEVKHLSVKYGSIRAVEDASFTAESGSLVAVLGQNGAGKSTLLNTVAGLMKPAGGTVMFRGRDITGRESHLLVREGIVLVPEGRHVVGSMSVRDNLLLGTVRRSQYANLEKVFSLLPVLREKSGQRAGLLSGGEQQMLAIGRAVMSEPELILIDEPTLGLSPIMSASVLTFIRQLSDEGRTIVLVEQNIRQALKIADRVYFMQKGRTTDALSAVEVAQKLSFSFVSLSEGGAFEKQGTRW